MRLCNSWVGSGRVNGCVRYIWNHRHPGDSGARNGRARNSCARFIHNYYPCLDHRRPDERYLQAGDNSPAGRNLGADLCAYRVRHHGWLSKVTP